MRRTVINKSTAIKAVILIFAVLIILSVYPLRLWQRTITDHGDALITQTSDRINDYHDVVQKFIARYDRIDSIDVYVEGLEKGQYMSVVIYKPTMEVYYEQLIYLGDKELPGYVNIPLKLDLEVGETYTLLLNGCLSTFYVGYCASDLALYPYVINFAYHDTEVSGICLAAKYNYEQPISKRNSLIIILAVAAIAALMIFITGLVYKNKKDKLITVHRVIRFVGNPIAVGITLTLMVMIYPLQVFDTRTADIIFYEIGVLISGIIMLYAINHENDATLDIKPWHSFHNVLRMGAIAAAIWFCCEYMNAFYTIYQTLAERKELICLLILLCLMLPRERVLKSYNLVYAVAAYAVCLWYRSGHLLADTEKEYDLHNAATTYGVIIAWLTGFILLSIAAETVSRIKKRAAVRGGKVFEMRPSVMGIILMLLGIVLAVFRNTRWWGVVLTLFMFALMFCFGAFETSSRENKKNYIDIVAGGLMLNFVISMVYCWLYRSFAAFNTGRFPFVFHTVTVTAEYMTVMVCASMVLLLYKIYDTRDIASFRDRFKYLWKEFVLFGFVTAYMIFTISRTAYLACMVMFVFVAGLTAFDNKKGKLKYFLRQFVTMALAVILCFPAAFTLQRILPAIYGHPKTYMIENQNYALNGGGNPASSHFMGIERFVDLFGEKILSIDLIDYNYPEDIYNYDEDGNYIYGETGVYVTKKQAQDLNISVIGLIYSSDTDEETKQYLLETAGNELIAIEEAKAAAEAAAAEQAAVEDTADEQVTEEVSEDTADGEAAEESSSEGSIESFSNGRLTIFKSYLEQMTLWGHDEMGALLPSGEVAVHAHNTYIQVMYDNGILAGVFFLLMMATAVFAGGKYYMKNKDEIPGSLLPYAMTICFGVAAVSEWVFQFSNPMTIALILALMPIALKENK